MRPAERRTAAATKYQPEQVQLLLIGEAPPSALDRYFYFENVHEQDSLFRHVVRAVLAEEPMRAGKGRQLERLEQSGVFLIDLKPDPKLDGEMLAAFIPDLVSRAVALRPAHVITIKANVCDLAQPALRAAGLHVVDARVSFPGSGRQRRFLDAMRRALESIDWAPA